MGETISLDDYTTLPGKSGATHSISLCIAGYGPTLCGVRFFLTLPLILTRSESGLERESTVTPPRHGHDDSELAWLGA